MLRLYNAPPSTCSIKVRLALAEKGLEVELRWVDMRRGEHLEERYRELNPQAVVPTLVDDDAVVVESTLINEYLDDRFPDPPLRPLSAWDRYRMRRITQLLDVSVHPACSVVTNAVALRPAQLRQPREQVLATIDRVPDPERRRQRRSLFAHGVESPLFAPAVEAYVVFLDELESALEQGPWLAGDDFSLADCGALPYVMRLEHIALEALWSSSRRPRLGEWYERCRERASWATAVEQHLEPKVVEAFRAAGEAVLEHTEVAAGLR